MDAIAPRLATVGNTTGAFQLFTHVRANGDNMAGFAPPGQCAFEVVCPTYLTTDWITDGPTNCTFSDPGLYSLCYR